MSASVQPRPRRMLAAGIAAAAVLALPAVVTGGYALGIVNLMLVNVIVVLGLNVIWGFAGQIALGQAGFVAVGAYAVAVMSTRLHLPFWLDLGCGALLVSLCALGLGLATLKLKSFYLGLATLSFGEIVTQVLLNWKALSESANGIVNIPQASLLGAPLAHGWQQYYLLLVFGVAGAVFSRRLIRMRFGLECRAVRGNERAAEMVGIDAFRIKLTAFVISAVYGGVAGGLYAQLYQAVSPDVFSFDYMVSILAMLLIGGAGTTEGAALGAVVVTLLPELLRFLGKAYLMVYGFGLVALIIYAPRGIWGAAAAFLSRGLRRRAAAPGAAADGGAGR